MAKEPVLRDIELQNFGNPSVEPNIPKEEYERRISALKKEMAKRKLDIMVIYGDREHCANIAFLCGFDPRFEEALLIVPKVGVSTLMVGTEMMAYANGTVPIDVEKVLVQSFSAIGLGSKNEMKEIEEFFKKAGLNEGMRVGTAGWKYFTKEEFKDPEHVLEIPSFIVDGLRKVVGRDKVLNCNDILMHPDYGLRATNSVDQLASFEFAATFCSQTVHDMINGLEAGMTEYEATQLMRYNGIPLNCHVCLMTGDRLRITMASPTIKRIEYGDPLIVGFGLWGALTARAGYVVKDAEDLGKNGNNYLKNVCMPYFRLAARWYETIKIGMLGGEFYEGIHRFRDGMRLTVAVSNPGHLIHIDEFMNTPFYSGSTIRLKSGMAIQIDMYGTPKDGGLGSHVEDGIALADDDLKDQLKAKYPESYARIEKRKSFMRDILGIQISDDVLPLSNNPALLRPFLLSKNKAVVFKQ